MSDDPVDKIRKQRKDPNWRAFADKTAEAMEEAAAKDTTPVEEKLAEAQAANPQPLGLPTTWKDGAGKTHLPTTITQATAQDIDQYTTRYENTCGACRFFNLEEGRKEIYRQGVARRLVLEQEWKLKHLGAPLDHCGLCDASNGEMMTTTISKACDQFRPRSKLFRR